MVPVRHSALGTLFDFSFTEFLTLSIIRILYGVAVAAVGLLVMFIALAGFQRSFLTGLGTLVIAGLLFVLTIVIVRVWLEAAVVFFRIADNTAEIAEHAARIAVNTASQTHPSGAP